MPETTQPGAPVNLDDGLVTAAATGDRLAALQQLRAILAARIAKPRTAARDVAALSRQLTEVMVQIEAATRKAAAKQKGTATDELAARRAARQPGADVRKATVRKRGPVAGG